jgi:hypothetical protein
MFQSALGKSLVQAVFCKFFTHPCSTIEHSLLEYWSKRMMINANQFLKEIVKNQCVSEHSHELFHRYKSYIPLITSYGFTLILYVGANVYGLTVRLMYRPVNIV